MSSHPPPPQRASTTPLQVLLVCAAYVVAWTLLDLAAGGFRVAKPNISLWYPPAGVMLALLLCFGLRFLPLLLLSGVLGYLISGDPSLGIETYVLSGAAKTVVYGAAAGLLLYRVRIDPRLLDLRDVLWLVAVAAVVAPALLGLLHAAIAAWQGTVAWSAFWISTAMYWAGDATGALALGPPLLLLSRIVPGVWAGGRPGLEAGSFSLPFRDRQERIGSVLIVAAATGAALLAFRVPGTPSLDHTYVLFIPTIVAAVYYGFGHAAFHVLVLNVAVVLVAGGQIADLNGVALQFDLAAVTATGVLMGAFISERRQREAELQEAKQAAEAAARAKDVLLSQMSHEIRTPLTGIIGYADLLAGETAGELGEFARTIQQSGRRLLRTLTNMLELARAEAGVLPGALAEVDLTRLGREVIEELRPNAEAKGLLVRHITPAALPATVNADAVRSILLNLTDNAIKFTEEGEVRIAMAADGEEIQIAVVDTGPGISESFLPQVFEPFRQASEGLSREHEGSGLGLAIVERMTRALGGAVTVSSVPGQGTRFEVRLPRRPPRAAGNGAPLLSRAAGR